MNRLNLEEAPEQLFRHTVEYRCVIYYGLDIHRYTFMSHTNHLLSKKCLNNFPLVQTHCVIMSSTVKSGVKAYILWGSRVPLIIPHFEYVAATGDFYTHPNYVPGVYSCHFWVKRTKKTSSFLKTGHQAITPCCVAGHFLKYQQTAIIL